MPALSCRSTMQRVIATVMAVVAVAGWLPIVSIPAAAAAAKIRVVRLGAIEATSGLVVGDHCVFVSSDRHIDQPLVVIDRATFSVTRSLKNTPTTSMVAIGDSLFVVPRSGSPINRYEFSSDCTTFVKTGLPIGPYGANWITVAGPRLWMSGGTSTEEALIEMDPTTGDYTAFPGVATWIIGTAERNDRLWTSVDSTSWVIDLTTDPPSLGPQVNLGRLTVAGDGTAVFGGRPNTCVAPWAIVELTAALAETDRCYAPTSSYVRGFAADPTAERLSAIEDVPQGPLLLETWSTVDGSLLSSIPLPMNEGRLAESIAYSPDGLDRYVVSNDSYDGDRRLTEIPGQLGGADLIVDAPKKVAYGDPVTVTVELDAEAPTTNATVKLFAARTGGPARLVAEGEVDANGLFTYQTTAKWNTVYSAKWGGDASHLAVGAKDKMSVTALLEGRLRGFYGSKGEYKLYRVGDEVTYVVGVRPAQDDWAELRLFRRKAGRWKFYGHAYLGFGDSGVLGVWVVGLTAGRYRLATFFENKDFVRSASNWSYFQMIKGTGSGSVGRQIVWRSIAGLT